MPNHFKSWELLEEISADPLKKKQKIKRTNLITICFIDSTFADVPWKFVHRWLKLKDTLNDDDDNIDK